MKKIGIIGSGSVAKTLAEGFKKHGYQVKMGTRSLDKLSDWAKERQIEVGSFADAAHFGDPVVLAVKGSVAKDALALAGVDSIKNKVIIDATNPIADLAPTNGVLHFSTDLNVSLMEQLQQYFPDAHFVKAFNSVGAALMVNPDFGGTKPSMFICGNNNTAKEVVSSILTQFGWETEDMGHAEAARAIEPLCMLWCIPGFLHGKWVNHAFKLLKK